MSDKTTTHECPQCGDVHLQKEQPDGPFGRHLPTHEMLGFDAIWGRLGPVV